MKLTGNDVFEQRRRRSFFIGFSCNIMKKDFDFAPVSPFSTANRFCCTQNLAHSLSADQSVFLCAAKQNWQKVVKKETIIMKTETINSDFIAMLLHVI